MMEYRGFRPQYQLGTMSKVRKLYPLPRQSFDVLGKDLMDKTLEPFFSGIAHYTESPCIEWAYVKVGERLFLLLTLDSPADTDILSQRSCITFAMGVLLMGALGDQVERETIAELQEKVDKMDFNDFMNEMLK